MYNHPFADRFCGKMMNACGPRNSARWAAPWMRPFVAGSHPPANISQDDEAFTIAIYAAGIRKEAVRITAKDDVLTVSYAPGTPDTRHYDEDERHEEWAQQRFRRRFALNGKVLANQVSARYTDGVLTITLPKNPDTNTPKVTVTVA